MTSTRFGFETGAASAQGARQENQDAFLNEHPVYLVADGMGGHQNGRAAADAMVHACEPLVGPMTVPLDALGGALVQGAERVAAMGAGDDAPGSTAVGAAIVERDGVAHWCVFNVGDSRAYLFRDGHLDQVTVDHSLAQEAAEAGRATGRPAAPVAKNIITRAFGAGLPGIPEIDRWMIPVQPGDAVLLCTDGVWGSLDHDQLTSFVALSTDLQESARGITEAALAAGSRDNVTAVLVRAIG